MKGLSQSCDGGNAVCPKRAAPGHERRTAHGVVYRRFTDKQFSKRVTPIRDNLSSLTDAELRVGEGREFLIDVRDPHSLNRDRGALLALSSTAVPRLLP